MNEKLLGFFHLSQNEMAKEAYLDTTDQMAVEGFLNEAPTAIEASSTSGVLEFLTDIIDLFL